MIILAMKLACILYIRRPAVSNLLQKHVKKHILHNFSLDNHIFYQSSEWNTRMYSSFFSTYLYCLVG